MFTQINAHFKALRPHQWVKNGFVLAPLIFSANVTDLNQLKSACISLFAFCLDFASSVCTTLVRVASFSFMFSFFKARQRERELERERERERERE